MNIALVCPYDIFRAGGVQSHIRDVAATLRELGHNATIIAPGPAPDGATGSDIVMIGTRRSINFNRTKFEISIALGAERRRLKTLLARERFDVIHFHTIWTPLLPFQILWLSSSANVATFHDTPPPTVGGIITRSVFRAISKVLLPRLDGAIAVSESPAAHLVSVDGRRPEILPPCTDLKPFFEAGEPLAEFRDEKLNILYLGRMDQRKGIYQLLDAYRVLCHETTPLRLIVAGGGGEVAEVRDYVSMHGLPDVVLLGAFAEAEKPNLYATADIFCSPALYGESFGIVLVEAMACGKPVAAAANSGYRTVLTGAGARFLSPPGDVAALADRLRLLIEDADLRRSMGAWGRNEARQYDCREVVPRLVDIYREALTLKG